MSVSPSSKDRGVTPPPPRMRSDSPSPRRSLGDLHTKSSSNRKSTRRRSDLSLGDQGETDNRMERMSIGVNEDDILSPRRLRGRSRSPAVIDGLQYEERRRSRRKESSVTRGDFDSEIVGGSDNYRQTYRSRSPMDYGYSGSRGSAGGEVGRYEQRYNRSSRSPLNNSSFNDSSASRHRDFQNRNSNENSRREKRGVDYIGRSQDYDTQSKHTSGGRYQSLNSAESYGHSRSGEFASTSSSRGGAFRNNSESAGGGGRRTQYASQSTATQSRSESGGDRFNPKPSKTVGIFGLNYETSERDLEELFSRFGKIVEMKMIRDNNGQSRGFCFLTYTRIGDAFEAKEAMSDKKLHGRFMRVDFSCTDGPYKTSNKGHHPPGGEDDSYHDRRRESPPVRGGNTRDREMEFGGHYQSSSSRGDSRRRGSYGGHRESNLNFQHDRPLSAADRGGRRGEFRSRSRSPRHNPSSYLTDSYSSGSRSRPTDSGDKRPRYDGRADYNHSTSSIGSRFSSSQSKRRSSPPLLPSSSVQQPYHQHSNRNNGHFNGNSRY